MGEVTLAELVVQNVRDIIAEQKTDEAKVLRKAKLNQSFFSNFDKSASRNINVSSVEKLAGALGVPSAALFLKPDIRSELIRVLRNYGTMLPGSADRLEAIVTELRVDRADPRSPRPGESDTGEGTGA